MNAAYAQETTRNAAASTKGGKSFIDCGNFDVLISARCRMGFDRFATLQGATRSQAECSLGLCFSPCLAGADRNCFCLPFFLEKGRTGGKTWGFTSSPSPAQISTMFSGCGFDGDTTRSGACNFSLTRKQKNIQEVHICQSQRVIANNDPRFHPPVTSLSEGLAGRHEWDTCSVYEKNTSPAIAT